MTVSKASAIPREMRLTLIEDLGKGKWTAICKCGWRGIVHEKGIKRGIKRSCGCLRREIVRAGTRPVITVLPGRHGKWTVHGDAPPDKNGKRRVRATCDCGFKSTVYAAAIREGRSSSCIACSPNGRPKRTPVQPQA